jgi:hypothetical protein
MMIFIPSLSTAFHVVLDVLAALSSWRWQNEAIVSKSSASCSVIFQEIFGARAGGVAESSKHTFHQIQKALLFGLLGFG